MKDKEKQSLRARSWSAACHHAYGLVDERSGFHLLLLELREEGFTIDPQVAWICQSAYQGVREIISQGGEPQDAYALMVTPC